MDRFLIVIIVIFLVSLAITYLLHRFFKTKRFVKYLPPLICLIAAVINLRIARITPSEGFRDLAHVLMSMLLFTGFVSGLLSSLYFDLIAPKFKR
jgi:cytochrome bd-type quinol oxidase subunit 2